MVPLISKFANAPAYCVHQFLGLIPWYQYLTFTPGTCNIDLNLAQTGSTAPNWDQIWLIGIAVLDDLLRVAGAVAVIFIIYGGIRYITSQGQPENVKGAQATLLAAIIGLVIALVSTDAVNFIGNQLGGTVGASGLPEIAANQSLIQTILDIVFSIIGAISLLMIVLSGFKYVTSGGNSEKASNAKNTLLYSLIGLAISVFAFVIVNFILIKLG